MKSDDAKQIDFPDKSVLYYLFPLLSYGSMSIVLEGSWSAAFYDLTLHGWQAVGLGTMIFILSLFGLFEVLYCIPKKYKTHYNGYDICKLVLYSPFVYIWLFLFVTVFFIEYNKPDHWYTIWLIMLGVYISLCYVYQRKLLKEIMHYIHGDEIAGS